MKFCRKVSALIFMVCMVGTLWGCGSASFEPTAYLSALLDNSYKGDPAAYVEQKIGSEREASKLYTQGIDSMTQGMLAQSGVSDEMQKAYSDMFSDLLKCADYQVGEAEEQKDHSYAVKVTYRQMKVYGPAIEEYQKQLDVLAEKWSDQTEEPLTDQERNEALYQLLLDCLNEAIVQKQFEEEMTTSIRIEKNNKVYSVNNEDMKHLTAILFDTEALADLH